MGNVKTRQLRERQADARARLAAEAEAATARIARAQEASDRIWSALKSRSTAEERRDATFTKAEQTYQDALQEARTRLESRRAHARQRAEAAYSSSVSGVDSVIATAVRQLLDDRWSPKEVADLTGLAATDVRRASRERTSDPKPSAADTAHNEPADGTPALSSLAVGTA